MVRMSMNTDDHLLGAEPLEEQYDTPLQHSLLSKISEEEEP